MHVNDLPAPWTDYLFCRHFGNSAGYKDARFRASCILGLAKKQGKSWDKRLPIIVDVLPIA